MAPRRRTQSEAAAEANLRASASGLPSSRATANAAVKQSPAPVVSTTGDAGMAACLNTLDASTHRLPSTPSFTCTQGGGVRHLQLLLCFSSDVKWRPKSSQPVSFQGEDAAAARRGTGPGRAGQTPAGRGVPVKIQ